LPRDGRAGRKFLAEHIMADRARERSRHARALHRHKIIVRIASVKPERGFTRAASLLTGFHRTLAGLGPLPNAGGRFLLLLKFGGDLFAMLIEGKPIGRQF
jgi:hypothetical protein